MKERDFPIDFLRTLGLFAIILAHVSPPALISQLRSFDVPLMVVISGYVFAITKPTSENTFKLIPYVKNRFVRLAIPVWIFLSFFFILVFISSHVLNIPFPFGGAKILSSYLLWNGIGYVWIIRVFLMIAICGPLFIKKIEKFKNKLHIIAILYVSYEIIFLLYTKIYFKLNDNLNLILIGTLFYLIPYLLFFTYGTFFRQMKKNTTSSIILILVITLVVGIWYTYDKNGVLLDIRRFKYPPTSFYTTYAILRSTLLLKYINIFEKIKSIKSRTLIHFIGSSTLWIYLWHIPIVLFLHFAEFNYIFIKYILVICLSICITFIQQKFLYFLLTKNKLLKSREKLLKIIFTG